MTIINKNSTLSINSRSVNWVQALIGCVLENFESLAVDLLCEAFDCGPWNVPIKWEKTDWNCGEGVFCVV